LGVKRLLATPNGAANLFLTQALGQPNRRKSCKWV